MIAAILKMKLIHTIISLFISLALHSQDTKTMQYKLYQSIDAAWIDELLDARPYLLTQADNIYGIQIQKNDILFFVTSDHKLGKMQILSFDEHIKMIIRFTLYDFNNSVSLEREAFVLDHNLLIDIDHESSDVKNSRGVDLKWGDTENPTLFPQNNISVFLLNKSRHADQISKLNQ